MDPVVLAAIIAACAAILVAIIEGAISKIF
jgi:uncharacterized membrane protein affecting hemolysin expression